MDFINNVDYLLFDYAHKKAAECAAEVNQGIHLIFHCPGLERAVESLERL